MRLPRVLLAAVLLLPAGLAAPAHAQDGFLFRPPRVTLSVRAVHAEPRARGDVYDFMTRELTLERGDFAGQGFGIDAALRANDRLDLVLGLARVQSTQFSESREYIGEDDLPIEQTTKLLRVPVTVSLRLHPLARGRTLGRHAWVPARLTPWVQAGGGMQWYRLTQEGDFVDAETLAIFADDLRANGTAMVAQVGAGVDYWVTSHIGVSADARYGWGKADLNRSFRSFEEIDLRGYQAALGIAFRF